MPAVVSWEKKLEVWRYIVQGEPVSKIPAKARVSEYLVKQLKKEWESLPIEKLTLLPTDLLPNHPKYHEFVSHGPKLVQGNGEPTVHQAQLREMMEHIIGYTSGLRPAVPLTARHPLQQLPVEDDPAYQALKEHCRQSELWQLFDNYMKFENDRFQFCLRHTIAESAQAISFQMTHAGQRSPDEIRKEEEWNSLRKRHSEVCDCVPETRLRLAKGFKELLLFDKIPGDCHWCRGKASR